MIDLCAIADVCARMDKHEGQAAWFQGVFSVVAILAAVWIDQGAARRARDERAETQRLTLSAKRDAISECIDRIHEAINNVSALDLTNSLVIAERPLKNLWIAQRLLDYAAVPGDGTPPAYVFAIVQAAERMLALQERLKLLGPITTETTRTSIIQALDCAASELVEIRATLDKPAG